MRASCVLCGFFGNHKRRDEGWLYYCSACRANAPSDELRCSGVNSNKVRCGQWKKQGEEYCSHHQNQKEE